MVQIQLIFETSWIQVCLAKQHWHYHANLIEEEVEDKTAPSKLVDLSDGIFMLEKRYFTWKKDA